MELCKVKCLFKTSKKRALYVALVVGIMLAAHSLYAQNGAAGIQDANTKVRSYFADALNLMYAIGAITGLIGAVKVFQKWSSGDPDTGRTAAAWFGSCVFLVVVATVLRAFFGV